MDDAFDLDRAKSLKQRILIEKYPEHNSYLYGEMLFSKWGYAAAIDEIERLNKELIRPPTISYNYRKR